MWTGSYPLYAENGSRWSHRTSRLTCTKLTCRTKVQPPNEAVFFEKTILSAAEQAAESEDLMEFFNSAVDTLQTIVVGLGGALCVWGGINLLEGYGQDNPGSNAHVR